MQIHEHIENFGNYFKNLLTYVDTQTVYIECTSTTCYYSAIVIKIT